MSIAGAIKVLCVGIGVGGRSIRVLWESEVRAGAVLERRGRRRLRGELLEGVARLASCWVKRSMYRWIGRASGSVLRRACCWGDSDDRDARV
jgi:hypothetical protein